MLVAFIKWNEGPAREPYCVRHSTIGRLGVTLVLAVAVGLTGRVAAQSGNAADVAGKLSGHWKLNEELTPASAKPDGRGRGQPLFAIAGSPVQRGGRGGGGGAGGAGAGAQPGDASSPLMAEEVAAQAALSGLHQVPKDMTIEATADSVVFRDPRGAWHFKI